MKATKITVQQLHEVIEEAVKDMLAEKGNEYAICTASIAKTAGNSKRSEWSDAAEKRYEDCKDEVKKESMQGISEGGVGEVAENEGLQKSIKDVVIATIKASTGGSDVDEGIVDTSIKQMLSCLGMIGA